MASIKAVIVHPDGTAQETEIDSSLESFQAVVGGYIEGVFGRTAMMYVNEEGLLMRLPHNPFATLFAHEVLDRPVTLYGTALILGPADSEGVETPVRPEVVDYFIKEN